MSSGHMIVQSYLYYQEKGHRRYTTWMTVLDGCHRRHYWTPRCWHCPLRSDRYCLTIGCQQDCGQAAISGVRILNWWWNVFCVPVIGTWPTGWTLLTTGQGRVRCTGVFVYLVRASKYPPGCVTQGTHCVVQLCTLAPDGATDMDRACLQYRTVVKNLIHHPTLVTYPPPPPHSLLPNWTAWIGIITH